MLSGSRQLGCGSRLPSSSRCLSLLRAMIMGAPLEARHLAQRYDKMYREAEAQTIEVSRRQQKVREAPGNVDNSLKLEAVESKLQEFKSNMSILGKEAVAAMTAVEAQQQRLSLQRLIAMIESERTFQQRVLQILDQLEGEIVLERQRIEASPVPTRPPQLYEANDLFNSSFPNGSTDSMEYFIAEVMHSHMSETDVELSLSVGDYVVVRKVSGNGWAEGECRGKAGWFPYGYIERRGRVLASEIAEAF